MLDWLLEITQKVREDFSDLPDAASMLRITVRLTMALLLGSILGLQREKAGKEAGLRTHMLVALGAAIFILVPQQAGMAIDDLSRVIQGLTTGIGFIGAGTILKLSSQEEIKGLTTAASIWLTASIGMSAGMGREATAVLTTAFAFIILAILPTFEQWLAKRTEGRK